jgi:small subunit ribosomal protein S13
MARVAGVDLPREKRGEVAVTYIYGLGRSIGRRVLLKANVDPGKRVKAWTDDEVNRIREIIERELKVEGDLRREISMNVKRLMDIGAYRGIRHRRGLPVRGQRTHTNAQDAQGPQAGCDGQEEAGGGAIGAGGGTSGGSGAEEGGSVRHGRRSETSTPKEGRQAARAARGPHRDRPHPGDVQQHDRHAHRSDGQRRVLVERR